MARFIIHGGRPLSGMYRPSGNKNAALPMLAATLLTDKPVRLRNVPDIQDVRIMLELLVSLGVTVEKNGSEVSLCAARVSSCKPDEALCSRVRASILLAGPLAARHGRAELPPPGGDVIGLRRLDTHLIALSYLGITADTRNGRFVLKRNNFKAADMLLDEASVTATENVMMAAVLAPGRTTIYNAACEPHVRDLGLLLNKMGAKIRGLGTNLLTIHGVDSLNGAEHSIGVDFIEVGSYLAAAAATKGELTVKLPGAAPWLPILEKNFQRLGIEWQHKGRSIELPAKQSRRIKRDLATAIPKIEDGIWPAFPTDMMSVCIVLATQTRGNVLFFEKLFESRMYFVDNLLSMGAQIVACDPHRVVVNGPSKLRGACMNSPDIRAGMALVIAALCAKGESIIENAEIIDRGYERLDERLQALGARIERA